MRCAIIRVPATGRSQSLGATSTSAQVSVGEPRRKRLKRLRVRIAGAGGTRRGNLCRRSMGHWVA